MSVTVAWDAPGDPAVVGYKLSYGMSSGSYTTQIDVGTAVSKQLTGLSDTNTYYFMVQSYNSAGMLSDPSSEVSYGHAPFSITCMITNAVSTDGRPVAVTLVPPVIVGGTPPPSSAVCLPASGSLFPVGNTPVNCSASDATQTVSCQSVVTVTYSGSTSTTLTASPATGATGAPLTIQWTAPPQSAGNDWIGLYHQGAGNSDYLWWAYTNGATSGSINLPGPTAAGAYEFRYLQGDGYADSARSNAVTLTAPPPPPPPPVSATVTATPTALFNGKPLTVRWTASGTKAHDWVGLFLVGAPNTNSIWWVYTNGAKTGSVTIAAPAAGHYQFRYLLDDGYTATAHSGTVTVK